MCARTDTTLHGGSEARTVRRRLYTPSTGRSRGCDALTPRLDTPFSKVIGHCLALSDPVTDPLGRGVHFLRGLFIHWGGVYTPYVNYLNPRRKCTPLFSGSTIHGGSVHYSPVSEQSPEEVYTPFEWINNPRRECTPLPSGYIIHGGSVAPSPVDK